MNTLINTCIYEAPVMCQLLCQVHCCSNTKQSEINENTVHCNSPLNMGCDNGIFIYLFFLNQILTCSFKSELLDTFSVGDFIKIAFPFSKMEPYTAVDMKCAWTIHALFHEAP